MKDHYDFSKGKRGRIVPREPESPDKAREQLREMRWSFPTDFKFDRDEANERQPMTMSATPAQPPKLIDRLVELLEGCPDLAVEERAILKAAISMLDQRDYWIIVESQPGYDPDGLQPSRYRREDHPWRIQLTEEEWEHLPGQYWELFDGQPSVK